MVSTRGLKLKFFEGEKVLCYEPDPTKAKVLYESKVKDVVINKDPKGKKSVEYLIHFRGWNSSWDRCVSEEFILKDTVENRQLQKDLADKSKLQFGSYLYRKERKKHSRSKSDRVAASSEDGSCGSPAADDVDDMRGGSSSCSDSESVEEDESIPLEITDELRERLEFDYNLVHQHGRIHKLPAEPNIITILEIFWKHYATSQKYGDSGEKGRHRTAAAYNNGVKIKPEIIQRNVNVCQEVLDGVRIYFDFFLSDLLLYNNERGQTEVKQAHFLPKNKVKLEPIKMETEDQEYAHLPNFEDEEIFIHNDNDMLQRPISRRRTLRSYRSLDTSSNGSANSDNSTLKPSSRTKTNWKNKNNKITWNFEPNPVKVLGKGCKNTGTLKTRV
ncbi:PREDICTED: male-specific lethal 3 homolog isoform X2 [Nicrophorus vespilloides]|uniref:Male-specific lethal 3 homolog isoform X2 n=1 Tax=Nicrophorus vespilloides TaxID=110193 RepID=A0ABM1N6R3_NICVS|nr:PREDICTED: male-specific lethal 3 homolog isoform X2 [Nicrophorus vespilloides]